LEESGCGLVEAVSGNHLKGLRKRGKTSVRIASVPAEIRKEHLPNTNPELPLGQATEYEL
jgi:hypothetical protein